MIIEDDIKKKKNGRPKAEYTIKCGWIDWNHACADRTDLESIFSQIPHIHITGQKSLALNKKQLGGHDYYKISFQIDQSWKQKLMAMAGGFAMNYTFYVLDKGQGKDALTWYKRAALHIYMMGCCATETIQYYNYDSYHQSGFSMEDLVSNLIAFYMHAEGWTPLQIVQKSGGWINPSVATTISLEVFSAMNMKKATQPKCFRWFQAYLYNHIIDIHKTDKRRGWQTLPNVFQTVKPLPGMCNIPPPELISEKEAVRLNLL